MRLLQYAHVIGPVRIYSMVLVSLTLVRPKFCTFYSSTYLMYFAGP